MKKTALVRIKHGHKIKLRDIDPGGTGEYSNKAESLPRLEELRERFFDLQEALYAEHKRSVLLVLQAMDTGGKDGAVKSIMQGR
jgi:polyphosphate kinase 2 (PPK2 family)